MGLFNYSGRLLAHDSCWCSINSSTPWPKRSELGQAPGYGPSWSRLSCRAMFEIHGMFMIFVTISRRHGNDAFPQSDVFSDYCSTRGNIVRNVVMLSTALTYSGANRCLKISIPFRVTVYRNIRKTIAPWRWRSIFLPKFSVKFSVSVS
jgi:hypothetical protein